MRALLLGDGAQEPFHLGRAETERLRDQRSALGLARHTKAAVEPRRACIFAQDQETERMEGVNCNPFAAIGKQRSQPLAHFRGGAAGKGDGETSLGSDAALSVRVFPDPGPAMINSGPSTVSAAWRWSSSSCERRGDAAWLLTSRSRGRVGAAVSRSSAGGLAAATGFGAADATRFEIGASNSNPPAVSRASSSSSNRRMTPYSPS